MKELMCNLLNILNAIVSSIIKALTCQAVCAYQYTRLLFCVMEVDWLYPFDQICTPLALFV